MTRENLIIAFSMVFLVCLIVINAETTPYSNPDLGIASLSEGASVTGIQETSTGTTYTIRHSGEGPKELILNGGEEGTEVKITLPETSEAQITKQKDGTFIFDCKGKSTITVNGSTFKDVKSSNFKINKDGKLRSADFIGSASTDGSPSHYIFSNKEGVPFELSRKGKGDGRIIFNAETGQIFSGAECEIKATPENDLSSQKISSIEGVEARFGKNGEIIYAELLKGGTYTDKPGFDFSSDLRFKIITNENQRNFPPFTEVSPECGEVFIHQEEDYYDATGKVNIETNEGFKYEAGNSLSKLTYLPKAGECSLSGDGTVIANGIRLKVNNNNLKLDLIKGGHYNKENGFNVYYGKEEKMITLGEDALFKIIEGSKNVIGIKATAKNLEKYHKIYQEINAAIAAGHKRWGI